MKKIWAPWRLEYIKNIDDAGCFLCRITEEDNDRENLLLKRGKHCGVVMNRYPYTNGHLLIYPYRHRSEPGDLNPEERLEMMDLLEECLNALRSTINPEGFNIGINLGRVAGAGLEDHLHTHIVPRWNGDTNFMAVLGDVKIIPQALLDLYDQLWSALQ